MKKSAIKDSKLCISVNSVILYALHFTVIENKSNVFYSLSFDLKQIIVTKDKVMVVLSPNIKIYAVLSNDLGYSSLYDSFSFTLCSLQ